MKKLVFIIFFIFYSCSIIKAQNKWVLHSYGYGTKTELNAYEWKYSLETYVIEINDSLFTCNSFNNLNDRYYLQAHKKTIGDSVMYLYGELNKNIVGAFYYKINLNDSLDRIYGDSTLVSTVKNKIKENKIGTKYVYYNGLSQVNYVGNNIIEFRDEYNFLLYWGICRKYSENMLEITIVPKGGFSIYGEDTSGILSEFTEINPFQYKIYLERKYYDFIE